MLFKTKAKQCLSIAAFLFFAISGFSQFTLKGKVIDQDGLPLAGATIQILDSYRVVSTDGDGNYSISRLEAKNYQIKVSFIGYESVQNDLKINGDTIVTFSLAFSPYLSKEFTVIGTRLDQQSPIAYTTLDKKSIAAQNLGQDMPELLSLTPSVVFTSDAGNGIGYSYMRMRGSDQSNINVSINGIPVNDAESQQVFWVDLPDLSSSTEDIQIQRGVGTSTNGAGAFGGSVNIQTEDIASKAGGEVNLAYGSFNTIKANLKLSSGIINKHWSMALRGSLIQSDGYIDRSAAYLSSYFGALQYSTAKSSLRFIAFGGGERTHQAWYGVPRSRLNNDVEGMVDYAALNGYGPQHTNDLLNSDRRYNYYTYENEVDDYDQYHNQLHWNQEINKNLILTLSAFYTKGKGYFEQYQYEENAFDDNSFAFYGMPDPIIGNDTITHADFIRQRWLDNDFYGMVFNLRYTRSKWDVYLGGGANQYRGNHFGNVLWNSIEDDLDLPFNYYDNNSVKNDANVYLKANYALNEVFSFYGDLQYRYIDYSFLGIDNQGDDLQQNIMLNFFNPKAGISAQLNPQNRLFASFSVGNKEPSRDDYVIAPPNDQPKPQRLYDLELGYALQFSDLALNLTVYNMQYKDQLINTGELNDVGAEIRTNTPDSYRRGIEVELRYRIFQWLNWNINVTASQNKIKNNVEYIDNWDTWSKDSLYLGTSDISFSPNLIASSQLSFTLFSSEYKENKKQNLELTLISQYVSKQYLDNTSADSRSINAYFVNDIRLNYNLEHIGLRRITFIAMLKNVFDVKYVSNGWVYKYRSANEIQNLDGLFPQAGINYMLGLNVAF
jgi:iron complex outermembrane receptor protein